MNDDFLHPQPFLCWGSGCIAMACPHPRPRRAGMREGLELGANYIFWSPGRSSSGRHQGRGHAQPRAITFSAPGRSRLFRGLCPRATEAAREWSDTSTFEVSGQPHVGAFKVRARRDGETARRGQGARLGDLHPRPQAWVGRPRRRRPAVHVIDPRTNTAATQRPRFDIFPT